MSVRLLRGRGSVRHRLQQKPQRQATLHVVAWLDRCDNGGCRRAAVARRTSAPLSQTGQRLVAGQTEALPRHLRVTHVPAGQLQLVPRTVFVVVQHQRERVRVVPGRPLPGSVRSGRYESGDEHLHGPETSAVLKQTFKLSKQVHLK